MRLGYAKRDSKSGSKVCGYRSWIKLAMGSYCVKSRERVDEESKIMECGCGLDDGMWKTRRFEDVRDF
jgi:hypothetical protein